MAKPKKEVSETLNKSKNSSKKQIIEDSSDDEEYDSSSEQSQSDNENDPEETDEEQDPVDKKNISLKDNDKISTSNHTNKHSISLKLEIMKQVRENNKRKSVTHTAALKFFDWSKVSIEGYSTEEIKECFSNVIKNVMKVRTLDEIIMDYEKNFKKYESKTNSTSPKMPRNAVMSYIDDNREKLKKMYAKEHPNADVKKIGLSELSPFGSHVFNNVISEKERSKYMQKYREEMEAYKQKKTQFLKDNPELSAKTSKKATKEKLSSEKKPKTPKSKKEFAYITPFHLFVENLSREGRFVSHLESQRLYKSLSEEEKLKYIKKLIEDKETTREKQFSKEEQKLLKYSCGVPKKPASAYNRFVHDLSVKLKGVKEIVKIAPLEWKKLEPEEKEEYVNKYKKDVAKWQEKALAYIYSLPKEQQAEQLVKHGLLQKVDRAGAKKRRMSMFASNELEEPMEKKQKKKDSDNDMKKEKIEKDSIYSNEDELPTSSPNKTKKKNESKLDSMRSPSASPSKVKKEKSMSISPIKMETKKSSEDDMSAIESSPTKKSKFKEIIEKLGPYPSLTAAHYFMTQYNGKPHKIAKAYGKLSRAEKRQMLDKVNKNKVAYLKKVRELAENEKKYIEKIKQLHEKNKKEQSESLSWHKSAGTDEDSDTTSDSD